MPECAHRLMRCRPSLVRGRAAQVNPGGFTTPARRPSVPHRTAGCGKSSLRPLMAGSSPSLPDGSNPSAAIVQSASDVQCSRLLKTTRRHAHVTYQHNRKTIKKGFPHGSVWRQSFPHNFAATRRLVQRTVEGLSQNKCFPTGLGIAQARLAAFCA